MRSLSRPTALKIAAVLSFLSCAFSVVGSLPFITQGAAAVDQSNAAPPFVVLLIGLITGVVGLVAAYPTWKGQRLGIILTIVVNLVNGLSAAPGLLFAPTPALMLAAAVTVVISVLIIVFCLRRDPRPVLA